MSSSGLFYYWYISFFFLVPYTKSHLFQIFRVVHWAVQTPFRSGGGSTDLSRIINECIGGATVRVVRGWWGRKERAGGEG